jgi:DNA-binding CsgD family transcriptional regulator
MPKPRPATPAQPSWWTLSSTGSQDFLVATALLERPVPVAWTTTWAVEGGDVDRVLSAGVLQEVEEGLTPADAAYRAAILELAPWSQRQRVHLRLAEACAQPPARFETAAHHFERAGENQRAARAFLSAADAHCRRHRHAAAKRCFFRAFRLLPPEMPDAEVAAALQSLGRCAALAPEVGEAAGELRNWISLAPWCDRPAVRAEAWLQLSALLERDGRQVESASARRSAARDLAALGRDAEAAAASIAAATALAYAAQVTRAREAAEAAVHAAERVEDPSLQARAATWHGLILGMLGETAAGQAELTRAIDLALAHHLTGEAAEAQHLLGTVLEYASQYPDEQAAFARALKYCRRHGEAYTAGVCLGCLSYSYLRSGNWRRSEQTARQVVSDRKLPGPSRYVAESVLGLLHAHRGETRPALRHLRHSLEHCRGVGLLVMDFFNLFGLALVAESVGQVDEAARRYVELLEFWRSSDDRHDAIPGLGFATVFFATQGRANDAAAAAEALDRIASLTSNPEAAGAALAAAGELFLLQEDPAGAAAKFRQALTQFERRQLSVEPILTRLRLGTALGRMGAEQESQAVLAEARQQARRLGARPLAARADAALVVSAVRVVSESDSSVAAAWELLSPRQREVARELSRGSTNKEIAQQLGVSVRTIDMHVAHVLGRLNCRSRAEVASRVTAALA